MPSGLISITSTEHCWYNYKATSHAVRSCR